MSWNYGHHGRGGAWPVRLNGDAEIRALWRRSEGGDLEAAGAYAVEIARRGELDPAWIRDMLDTQRLVAVDAALRQAGLSPALYRAYGRILFEQIGQLEQWDDPGTFPTLHVPDHFGGVSSMLIRMQLHPTSEGEADSSYLYRHLPKEADRGEAEALIDASHVPQPWITVTARLSYGTPAHPWYLHLYPGSREGGLDRPGHIGEDTILLSELQAGGAEALAECVETAALHLDHHLARVNKQLDRVRQDLGVRGYEDAIRFVRGVRSVDPGTFRDAQLALSSVAPPPPSTAESATGRGLFADALRRLRTWLERPLGPRALVPPLVLHPLWQSEYPIDRYTLAVRGRRASRSPHPLLVEVRFDALAGLWSHLGKQWRGNDVPAQGEWRLRVYDAIPASTQALVDPIVRWIRRNYTGARVLIGNEGGWRVGRYDQPEAWREAP